MPPLGLQQEEECEREEKRGKCIVEKRRNEQVTNRARCAGEVCKKESDEDEGKGVVYSLSSKNNRSRQRGRLGALWSSTVVLSVKVS